MVSPADLSDVLFDISKPTVKLCLKEFRLALNKVLRKFHLRAHTAENI